MNISLLQFLVAVEPVCYCFLEFTVLTNGYFLSENEIIRNKSDKKKRKSKIGLKNSAKLKHYKSLFDNTIINSRRVNIDFATYGFIKHNHGLTF